MTGELYESNEGYGGEESTSTAAGGGSWPDLCCCGGGEELRDRYREKVGGQYRKFSSRN